MSDTAMRQVFIKVGTTDKDHPWYRCHSGAGCEEIAEDPPGWTDGVREVTVPRQPALVLYRHRQEAEEIWGVSWGPVPSGELDVIGRGMRLRLLTWFAGAAEAGAFAAGVLDEWWPRRGQGAAELGEVTRRAVADSEKGGVLVWAFLESCLRRWTSGAAPLVPPRLLEVEPLLAQPIAARLGELQLYLRGGADHFTRSSIAGQTAFLPVVVVTEGVVVNRLRSVGRALTDQAPSPDWIPFPAPLPPPQSGPGQAHCLAEDEHAPKTVLGFLTEVHDSIRAIGQGTKPDRGRSARWWIQEFFAHRIELEQLVEALAHRVKNQPDLAARIIQRVTDAGSRMGHHNVLVVLERIVVALPRDQDGAKNQVRHALGGLTGDGIPVPVRERASKLLESLGAHS